MTPIFSCSCSSPSSFFPLPTHLLSLFSFSSSLLNPLLYESVGWCGWDSDASLVTCCCTPPGSASPPADSGNLPSSWQHGPHPCNKETPQSRLCVTCGRGAPAPSGGHPWLGSEEVSCRGEGSFECSCEWPAIQLTFCCSTSFGDLMILVSPSVTPLSSSESPGEWRCL